MGDAGTRLLFKLRSGTHGLDEELGRHRGREGKCMTLCNLCGEDCERCGSLFVELPGLFRMLCIIFPSDTSDSGDSRDTSDNRDTI